LREPGGHRVGEVKSDREKLGAAEGTPAAGGESAAPHLARRLGLFDTTMLVMGGIVGAGIFMNPTIVAQRVHTPALILGVWLLGGLIAMAGAFIYAELACWRPSVGGQYAYLREAQHPLIAFLYGWALLLVIQTGGMAAVAVTFARYFLELTHAGAGPRAESLVAASALAGLTLVNCGGVRAGSAVQSALMALKILAIATLIGAGLALGAGPHEAAAAPATAASPFEWLTAVGAAMVPVLFAYGGWQTASFVAGEVRDPRRNLPLGLVIGVTGVIVLYTGVSLVCLKALGAEGLARTPAPASATMRAAFGEGGVRFIAAGIAISTLGFLSQGMLTAPRVYFAMAEDGLFFKSVGWLHPRTRVPVVAIALQGVLAMIIAMSGGYDQILNYVVSVDFIAFGLTGVCVFVFRRRAAAAGEDAPDRFQIPGHPFTTLFFIGACWLVVLNTIYKYPTNSLVGLGILLAGLPAYVFWRGWRKSK